MMAVLPSLQDSQASKRSRSFMAECRVFTGKVKRCWKRAIVCGVKPISGTNTSTCIPACRMGSMICRYTSVLPEPVIPSNKKGLKPWAAFIKLTASACSVVSWGLLVSFVNGALAWRQSLGVGTCSFFSTNPFLANACKIALLIPRTASSPVVRGPWRNTVKACCCLTACLDTWALASSKCQ